MVLPQSGDDASGGGVQPLPAPQSRSPGDASHEQRHSRLGHDRPTDSRPKDQEVVGVAGVLQLLFLCFTVSCIGFGFRSGRGRGGSQLKSYVAFPLVVCSVDWHFELAGLSSGFWSS